MASFLESVGAPAACLFGTWVKIASLETIELIAHAGFDFVVVDMEHAPHSFETAYRAIVAAQGFGMKALVRLADSGGQDVQRLLDSGADGLLVPRVRSADEAEIVTGSMLFPPRGSRGLGITSRAGRWGLDSIADYVAKGDAKILRAVQLEDPDALRDVAQIIAVDGVNAVFIGLGDLALVTGRPATHPDTEALVSAVFEAANALGVPCGTAVSDAAAARRAKERGFSFVMVSNDATLFGRAATSLMKEVRG